MGNVSLCFPKKIDRSDINVAEYLIEDGEIVGGEKEEDLQLHDVVNLGSCVEYVTNGYVVHMSFDNIVASFGYIVKFE